MSGGQLMAGPLCRQVHSLADAFLDAARHGETWQDVHAIRARLARPLQIGVAGAVSAGKSTVVNGLLANLLAPTGAGETTRVTTWYHGGEFEHAALLLRDGTTRQIFLTEDGRIPDPLWAPIEDVDALQLWLPTAPLLRQLSLVDTPGLYSLNDAKPARTHGALGSGEDRLPAPELDALLFLLHGQQAEVGVIEEFHANTRGLLSAASNVIGVVSKADLLGDDLDPLGAAERKARRLAACPELRTYVTEVVPVIGLLGETVLTEQLRERDLHELRRMADDPVTDFALLDAGSAVLLDGSTPSPDRARLLDMLGLYGLRAAVMAVQEGVEDLPALNRDLLRRSGFGRLVEAVERSMLPRADAIKADRALADLQRLAERMPEVPGRHLRGLLEGLTLRREMHGLRELAALRSVLAHEVAVPAWLEAELLRVAATDDPCRRLGLPAGAGPAEVVREAEAAAERVRAFASRPLVSPRAAAVADTLRISYAILAVVCRRAAVTEASSPALRGHQLVP